MVDPGVAAGSCGSKRRGVESADQVGEDKSSEDALPPKNPRGPGNATMRPLKITAVRPSPSQQMRSGHNWIRQKTSCAVPLF